MADEDAADGPRRAPPAKRRKNSSASASSASASSASATAANDFVNAKQVAQMLLAHAASLGLDLWDDDEGKMPTNCSRKRGWNHLNPVLKEFKRAVHKKIYGDGGSDDE